MSFRQFIDRLSRHLFWDIDPMAIAPGQHDAFLIARVMDRGTLDDVKLVWDYYEREQIRVALMKAPSLDQKTISFFANQFDLPPEAFRAFRRCGSPWKA
jgi:hypothetical protein